MTCFFVLWSVINLVFLSPLLFSQRIGSSTRTRLNNCFNAELICAWGRNVWGKFDCRVAEDEAVGVAPVGSSWFGKQIVVRAGPISAGVLGRQENTNLGKAGVAPGSSYFSVLGVTFCP